MTQKIPTPKSLHSDPQQTCVCRRSDTWMKSNALYKTSPARTVHWQRMPGGTHQAQKPDLWHLATYFWTWAEGCQDHQFVHDSLQNSSSVWRQPLIGIPQIRPVNFNKIQQDHRSTATTKQQAGFPIEETRGCHENVVILPQIPVVGQLDYLISGRMFLYQNS